MVELPRGYIMANASIPYKTFKDQLRPVEPNVKNRTENRENKSYLNSFAFSCRQWCIWSMYSSRPPPPHKYIWQPRIFYTGRQLWCNNKRWFETMKTIVFILFLFQISLNKALILKNINLQIVKTEKLFFYLIRRCVDSQIEWNFVVDMIL